MKQETLFHNAVLPVDDAKRLRGGGIIDTLRCVNGTVRHSASSMLKSIVLGGTIWGVARMVGIIEECSH